VITRKEYQLAQQEGKELLEKTGIYFQKAEFEQIAVADFGLSDLNTFGAKILTLVNTELIAVKLIAMHSLQIMPEHWHPRIGDYTGKEETLRVEWGEMYLYYPGNPSIKPKARIPQNKLDCFKHWNELIMGRGDQITLLPGVPHWFQASPRGVVVWSFSTKVLDLQDEFTDPEIRRGTVISDNHDKSDE